GSTDNTREVLNNIVVSKFGDRIKFLKIDINQGYGYAIKKAIAMMDSDYIGWSHGDGQTDLNDLVKVCSIIKKTPDTGIIKGLREERPLLDKFLSSGLALLGSIIFLCRLTELNAQPSVYKINVIPNFHFAADNLNFDIDAYLIARLGGATETRFPVKFGSRQFGISSWNLGVFSRLSFLTGVFFHLLIFRLKISRVIF
ncbi:glycosyltransferase, partial [Alphaproteobacteria bacterium]|nr:glycosyltransferase [Alphaproteobacteria bacterium]